MQKSSSAQPGHGSHGCSPKKFTSSSSTNGGPNTNDIQPWQTNYNAQPFARRHAATVTANGYIYYLGGLSGALTPASVNAVNYAKLNADGSVGTWNCQGTVSSATSCGPSGTAVANANSLPSVLYGAAATTANGYIYVIGGCTDSSSTAACSTRSSAVYYARLNVDGSTGAWQTNPYAGYAAGYASVVTANGYIYELGGTNGGAALTTVQSAKLNADGSTSAWTASGVTALSTGVFGHTSFVANGLIYTIGGCTDAATFTCTTPSAIVTRATPTLTGGLGAWTATTSLPVATGLHGATVLNGNVYIIGGRAGGAPVNSVLYAKLNADGSVGNWNTSINQLPTARQGASVTASNSYIYAIGGYDGTNVQGTVYYTGAARTVIVGGLDLVSGTGLTMSGPNGAGTLAAGDTNIVGTLSVANLSNLNGGLTVTGGVSIFSTSQSGNVALNISSTTSNASLFSVRELNTNFGSLALAGAFVSTNSYWGEEFTNNRTATGCTADTTQARGTGAPTNCTANTGPISVDLTNGGAGTGTCTFASVNDTVNGIERITATDGSSTDESCAEFAGSSTANDADLFLNSNNLPVAAFKVKAPATSSSNVRHSIGIGHIGTAASGTGSVGLTQIGSAASGPTGIWVDNCTTPGTGTTCNDTTWNAHVQVAGTASTNVDCNVTIDSSNFAYIRIEVLSAGASAINARVYIDGNVADGVNPTLCPAFSSPPTINGVAWGWFVNVDANGSLNGSFNYDIDYVRIWQDDAAPVEDSTPTTEDDANISLVTPTLPPISPDTSDPEVAGSFFNFLGATSEDTVFNHNVFVHGTLYADRIVANQIEGLSIFTDQLASLQEMLAARNNTSGSTSNEENNGSEEEGQGSGDGPDPFVLSLNIQNGLTIGGNATFNGNALFAKLVTFVEKAVFNNDVSFNSHISTGGQVLSANIEDAAGTNATVDTDGNDIAGGVSITYGDNSATGVVATINFNKSYTKPPRVLLTSANDATSRAQFYVKATTTGFKVFVTNSQVTGTVLEFNYWVVE